MTTCRPLPRGTIDGEVGLGAMIIDCECERFTTGRCASMKEAWAQYREHFASGITQRPSPPPGPAVNVQLFGPEVVR